MSCQNSPRHSSVVWSCRRIRRALTSLTALGAVLAATATARAQASEPPVPVPTPIPVMPTPMPQVPDVPEVPQVPQVPVLPQAPQPIVGYRAPSIALVQPEAGTALPPDKAVLVFRFVQGEPSDPLDASSFAVAVNGVARSAAFQVGASEAWGPLSDARAVPPDSYQVTARICSTRGVCGTTSATVTVASSDAMPDESGGGTMSRMQRVLEIILTVLRRLFGQ